MKTKFNSRLSINKVPIEKLSATKVLGVWLDENLSWETNTKNICMNAYTRMPVLSKLKYAGIDREELLTVYKLFIRCIPEYCSVVFHKALTIDQSHKIENIQKTCLKIILAEEYVDYETALNTCSLKTLHERREVRMLKFATKCINDNFNKKLFPLNGPNIKKEKFKVNYARTSAYMNSAIPQCQRLLNVKYKK